MGADLPSVRVWNLVFLVLGLAALTVTVLHVGPETLYGGIARIGVGFVLGCCVHAGVLLCDSLVLACCTLDQVTAREALRVIRAELAGHGINTATPLGHLGEITKYSLLIDRVPGDQVTAGIVLQNLVYFGSNVVFLTIVPAVAPLVLDLGHPTSTALYLVAAIFAVLGVLLLLLVRHGAGSLPFRMARRLGVGAARVERAERFWQRVEDAARQRGKSPRRMALVGAIAIVGRVGGAVEAGVYLAYAGADVHPLVACLTLANGQIMAWLTFFIPFQAGSAEGATWLLFRQLGLDPGTGVLIELVKKGRRVVFFLVGLIAIGPRLFQKTPSAPSPGT